MDPVINATEQIEMFACIDCEIQSIGMFDIDDPGLLFNDFNDSYYSYNYPEGKYNNIQDCEFEKGESAKREMITNG